MKSIKAKLQTRKATGGLLGAELTELAKAATAKDVPQPDEELNQTVIDAINSNSESSAYTHVRDVLHKRMFMKNPHKVWLATHLAEDILQKCPDTIGPIRSDIYQDLAVIAGKPLDRYQVNFKDEQRAKMHAFAILRSSKQGQSVLRHTLKMGRMVSLTPAKEGAKSQQRVRPLNANGDVSKPERTDSGSEKTEKKSAAAAEATKDAAKDAGKPPTANDSRRGASKSGSDGSGRHKRHKMTFEEAKENVSSALGVAGSHTSMIQDLVMNIAGGKSDAPEFERQFLGELVEELVSFRTAFEQLVNGLTSFKHEEAQPLVQKALESIDDMNNALSLCKDVTNSLPSAAEAGQSTDSPRAAAAAVGASTAAAGGGAPSRGCVASGAGSSRAAVSGGAGRGSKADVPSGRRSPLHQYAPAATASRSSSDPRPLESSIAALGLGEGKSSRVRSGKQNGGGRSQLQRAHSGGQVDPFLPAAAAQQPQPGAGYSQAGVPGSQPQFFMQGPVFYPQQGQQPQMQGPGFAQMPYAPMAQHPQVLYMPVTGPNGEQGFAPVQFPPGAQFNSGAQFPASQGFVAGAPASSVGTHQAPHAPPAATQLANGSAAANGSTHPINGQAQNSDIDGGVTDSESEMTRAMAGLTKFAPATASAPAAQLQQSAPTLVPQAAVQRPAAAAAPAADSRAAGKFDEVFQELVQ